MIISLRWLDEETEERGEPIDLLVASLPRIRDRIHVESQTYNDGEGMRQTEAFDVVVRGVIFRSVPRPSNPYLRGIDPPTPIVIGFKRPLLTDVFEGL